MVQQSGYCCSGVEAVQMILEFYNDKGIDLFKSLYKSLRQDIIGGPSIKFTRHHKSDETKIPNGEYTDKKIIGFDCNALYLWAIEQEQPTGFLVNDFHQILNFV